MTKNDKNVSAILLAAGQSKRFNQDKTFFEIDGIPIAIKSLQTILDLEFIDDVIIVSSKENYEKFTNYFKDKDKDKDYYKKIKIILGSDSRTASFMKAFDFINANNISIDFLIIHDAARPYVSKKLYEEGISLLETYDAVIPGLPPTDTVKIIDESDFVTSTLDRSKLINVQTPQFFNKKVFFNNIKNLIPSEAYTDDSSLLDGTSVKIKVIPGESENKKITIKNDTENKLNFYGTGFDIHQLINGEKLRIGGIDISVPFSLQGHSDGDVLIHSIIDSLLGAASLGDIGKYFPSSNKSLKNIDSTIMLEEVKEKIINNGFRIVHIDNTIIAQKPRMSDHIEEMKLNISKILKIKKKQINIKSTTTDFIGIIGSEKAIASQSICSLKRM
jgi:2-C-methyl-D-erythritol 2,4-cyclodiphosphate synthase/2-C-methyl-D-erythritol 4-phosphate cytidylyltransferase